MHSQPYLSLRDPSCSPYPRDFSQLHRSCLANDVETTRTLLKDGQDVNACTRYGLTCLHAAVSRMDPNMFLVRLLVESGADVNCIGPNRETVLQHAAWFGNKEVLDYLVEQGADETVTNRQGHDVARIVKLGEELSNTKFAFKTKNKMPQ
jgi:ankyrin repeat protein